MADANLNDEANHTRLSRLLIRKGTEALRKLFDTFHSSKLREFLRKNKRSLMRLKFKVIKENQWDLLFPSSGDPDSKNFDISLLSVLLFNICRGITSPATGWSTMPHDTDRSREANIVRLRLFRNKICHSTNLKVTDDVFEDLWSKISQTLIDLGIPKTEIGHLKTSPVCPEEVSYIETLKNWKIEEGEIKESLDVIEGSVRKIQKTTEEIFLQNQELLHKNQKASLTQQDTDENLLLKLPKFNFDGEIEELAGVFHPGTREWLFTAIENWFLTKGPKTFVLIAGPGVGKSVLAAKIIQRYKVREELVACHFCKFNSSNYSKPMSLVKSLARQICDTVKGFKEKLIEQLKGSYTVKNLQDAFQVYLKEPLHKLPRMKPMLVVIDALDECEREEKTKLLEVLAEEFSKLPTWLKVLVTTRPEVNTRKEFVESSRKSSSKCLEILSTDKNNKDDIQQYLTSKLSVPFQRIFKLKEECNGSFLFAFYLQAHLRNLRRITKEDMDDCFPKELNSVYHKYFDRLEEELKKVSEKYDINHLVRILAVAYEPIPLSFFTDGLELASDRRKMKKIIGDVNETISTLLYVSDDSVTVYHKSVVDWVSDKNHKYPFEFKEAEELLWKMTEKKFVEMKDKLQSNVSSISSFKGNTTMMYVLNYGFEFLWAASKYINVHFEWMVDVSLLHLMANACYFKEACVQPWKRFLEEAESSSHIQKKVSWYCERFEGCKVMPILVQDIFNEGPETIFSDIEKQEAKNILESHLHFWCEKLGYLATNSRVTACAFSSDGLKLVSCTEDGKIRIWNTDSLTFDKELSCNSKNVICCFWSKSKEIFIYHRAGDNIMLSRYHDSSIRRESVKILSNVKNDIPLAFSEQAFICKCSNESFIKVHRLTDTNKITTCIIELEYTYKFAITRDGSSILAANRDHLKIWKINGTTSTLAKEEKFELNKNEHKDCDCIREVLSCAISNNQKRGIISYYCLSEDVPRILVTDMDDERPGDVGDIILPYPATTEKLHFDFIEGNNNVIVSYGVDDDVNIDMDVDVHVDDDGGDDYDDGNIFYFVQSHKRVTVYSNKCLGPLTHFNHEGDLNYYKESSICRNGNMIALPQKSAGICMVKLHLPKPNKENLFSRIGNQEFVWTNIQTSARSERVR